MNKLGEMGISFALGLLLGIIICTSVFVVFDQKENHIITPIFSPENGNLIIDEIKSANSTIEIEMFVLTSEQIISELIEAKERGVEVRVILEKRDSGITNEETVKRLQQNGIDARFATREYKLTHAKIIIIDKKKLIIGSHNLTDAALEKNREASVIIRDILTISKFILEFEKDFLKASKE